MANCLPSKCDLQCIMKYEFDKSNSATVATKNINEVYGDKVSVRVCQQWFKKFRAGNFNIEDEPRSGRPKNLDDDVLQTDIEANPKTTLKELSYRLQCPKSTVHRHLKKLGKTWREGVWVPHEPSDENMIVRVNTCAALQKKTRSRSFLGTHCYWG